MAHTCFSKQSLCFLVVQLVVGSTASVVFVDRCSALTLLFALVSLFFRDLNNIQLTGLPEGFLNATVQLERL